MFLLKKAGLMGKIIKQNEDGYFVSHTKYAGGRVKEATSTTQIFFDKELKFLKYKKTTYSYRVGVPNDEITFDLVIPSNPEIKKEIQSALKALKKELKPKEKTEVLCQNFYTRDLYVLSVHKTAEGTFNSKEAGTRPDLVCEMTDELREKLNALSVYANKVKTLKEQLRQAEMMLRSKSVEIGREAFPAHYAKIEN